MTENPLSDGVNEAGLSRDYGHDPKQRLDNQKAKFDHVGACQSWIFIAIRDIGTNQNRCKFFGELIC